MILIDQAAADRALARARAASTAHPFEVAGRDGQTCAVCRKSWRAEVHQEGMQRTRVVLTIDHYTQVSPDEVLAQLTDALAPSKDLVLVDRQAIL